MRISNPNKNQKNKKKKPTKNQKPPPPIPQVKKASIQTEAKRRDLKSGGGIEKTNLSRENRLLNATKKMLGKAALEGKKKPTKQTTDGCFG